MKDRFRIWRFVALAAVLAHPAVGIGADGAWPTLHGDNQRSGHSPEVIDGPYERKWFRNFADEMLAARLEAIVAEDKVFVGSFAGVMRALDVTDGHTVWEFQADGPIGHSPCYQDGRVIFGDDHGGVYALRADTGRLLWRYQARGSVWTHPSSDGGRVYFGDRAGYFHAVDVTTGASAWEEPFHVGVRILTSASISEDGQRIVFAAEDMRARCLDPEGHLIWESERMGGLSVRDYAPTLWQGLAIFRTNPSTTMVTAPGQSAEPLKSLHLEMEMQEEDEVLWNQWGGLVMRPTARRHEAEQDRILAHYAQYPAHENFIAFDLETGEKPWVSTVLHGATGLHNVGSPPTFHRAKGDLYVWSASSLSNYMPGVPGARAALVRVDRETGRTERINHRASEGIEGGSGLPFSMPNDESQSLSLMGDNVILNTTQDSCNGMALDTGLWRIITGNLRDTYGGVFGPAALYKGDIFAQQNLGHAQGYLVIMANEWHGPARGVVAIAHRRFFWIAGSQVVCWGGPDVPAAASGGPGYPDPIMRRRLPVVPAGNCATHRLGPGFDPEIDRLSIALDTVLEWIGDLPNQRRADRARDNDVADLLQRLDALVGEQIARTDWAPLIVELGIAGEEFHFVRTADAMERLSLAMPWLSEGRRLEVGRWLDTLYDSGAPLRRPAFDWIAGERRETHLLGADILKAPAGVPVASAVDDLYGLWAYGYYGERMGRVLEEQTDAVVALFQAALEQPFQTLRPGRGANGQEGMIPWHDVVPDDLAEQLNRRIGGVLGYARLMQAAQRPEEVQKAAEELRFLLEERVHHERADSYYIRPTSEGTRSGANHKAKLTRYVGLVPEVASFVMARAGDQPRAVVREIGRQLPVWHHAFGERLVGGENYCNPPHFALALFVALTDGMERPRSEMARFLDEPWGRGDLYHIQKICALLRLEE